MYLIFIVSFQLFVWLHSLNLILSFLRQQKINSRKIAQIIEPACDSLSNEQMSKISHNIPTIRKRQ